MSKNQIIQHYHSASPLSSTDTTHALKPSADNLSIGEIAINNLSADPTIFIKNSDSAVVEFKSKEFVTALCTTLQNNIDALKGTGTMPTATGYTTLVEIANTLYTFLNEASDTDSIINKWKELENFLKDYTETDTLADLLAVKANSATKVIAGSGLTGGGTLASDITLNVGAGNGVEITDDAVSVKPANGSIKSEASGISVTVDDTAPTINVSDDSSRSEISPYSAHAVQQFINTFYKYFTLTGSGTTDDPYYIRFNGNAYATGAVTAYGKSTSSSGGGTGVSAFADCTDVALTIVKGGDRDLATGDLVYYNGTHWCARDGSYYALASDLATVTTTVGSLQTALNALATRVSELEGQYAFKTIGGVAATSKDDTLAFESSVACLTLTADTANKKITFAVSEATESASGLMSATDKKKIDGIEEGANKYIHPDSGAVAGSYCSVVVDAKGHVTSGSNIIDGGTF